MRSVTSTNYALTKYHSLFELQKGPLMTFNFYLMSKWTIVPYFVLVLIFARETTHRSASKFGFFGVQWCTLKIPIYNQQHHPDIIFKQRVDGLPVHFKEGVGAKQVETFFAQTNVFVHLAASCETPGERGVFNKALYEGSALRSNPVTFYITFLIDKVPLSYAFYWQMVPLYIPSLEIFWSSSF